MFVQGDAAAGARTPARTARRPREVRDMARKDTPAPDRCAPWSATRLLHRRGSAVPVNCRLVTFVAGPRRCALHRIITNPHRRRTMARMLANVALSLVV